MPWWTWSSASTQELQANMLGWERFSYWRSILVQVLCYTLFAGLFRAFEKGPIFTRRTVRLIQYLALLYFVSGLTDAFGPALFSLPIAVPTQLLKEIENLVVPSVALIAAWVMKEGSRIQEEQTLTI